MSSGLTGIAGRFRGRTIAREEMKEQPTNGQRHCGIGRSLPRYPIIERKTRRTRRIRKRRGKEERKRNGSQLWLPTAIRGGRHESHDDVTATMATSRRGQYVSLPELGAVPSTCSSTASSTLHRHEHRQRDGAQNAEGKKERKEGDVVRGEGLWTLLA